METCADIPLGKKPLTVRIPAIILSYTGLSFNEKLLLGLDYSFQKKKGYTIMTNVEVGRLFRLNPNIVGYCRKSLVNKGFLCKYKRKYTLTSLWKSLPPSCDNREVFLPFEIYNHPDINTGSKLLWGEYNSMSKGKNEYFAKREYTAQRLGASVESISHWTKILYENNLLKSYFINTGYCTKQKVVITCSFR